MQDTTVAHQNAAFDYEGRNREHGGCRREVNQQLSQIPVESSQEPNAMMLAADCLAIHKQYIACRDE